MTKFYRFLLSLLAIVYFAGAVAATDVGEDQNARDFRNGSAASGAPFRPGLMRIDFSLTAPDPTNWDGEIRLSRGSFANLVPLGVEPTCATTFFFADSARTRIGLQTIAPLAFCGFEATIFSPRDARLEISLRNRTTNRTFEKTVFIERLIDSSTKIPLDAPGSSVFIVRAPADELPVRVEKIGPGAVRPLETTVFKPGETLRVSVLPRSSATRLTDDLTLTLTATPRDGGEPFWSETRELPLSEIRAVDALVGDPNAAPNAQIFEFDAPQTEGVFNLTLELTPKKKAAKPTFALPQSKRAERPIARRVVQAVVAPERAAASQYADVAADSGPVERRGELLETIDPTNPAWRKTFSKRSFFPNFLKPNGAKAGENGDSGRFGLATPENSFNPTAENGAPRTFADNSPTPTFAPDADATILGQDGASSFGKNLFGFVFPQKSTPQSPEDAELERRELVRRWRSNRFKTFYPEIDRAAWGLTADLWAKPLSGGNSRVLDASELPGFVASPNGFVRLDPNGTAPRRADVTVPPAYSNDAAALNSTQSKESASSSRVSWEAYPVPVREPGKAHLLEIEYPASLPQKLGIAVLEPSPSGGLFQTTLDVGLVVGDGSLDDRAAGGVSRYSVLFWPKTKAPTILLTNRSTETPAVFGQIRVYRAAVERPVAPKASRGRSFGAALTKPTICDQFSAVRKPSPFGVLGSDDWTTFDDATTRALQHLSASNYDSAILAVAADGTALYPSALLAPTPRCDGGVFLPTGGDPVRKDALELALAKFDASGATLIPLLNLNAPLPSLEAELRRIHSNAVSSAELAKLEGIEPLGPDGRPLVETRQAADGTGPYYNVLHPTVQRVVLAVVQELATRCGARESFGGLALDVGANGWLALPDDVYCGMDDATFGRFVDETNLAAKLQAKGERRVQDVLFAEGPDRYRVRAEFVRDVCLNDWLDWRCDALCRFYREIRAVVAATRPDARLYLVATNALDGPVCQSFLYPSLRRSSKLRDALRLVGLDPIRFATDPSITLLRPEIVAPTEPLAQTARATELTTPDAIALFAARQAAPGALFFHRAEKTPLPEFDAASPYRPTFVELETRALPADFENRRRFARQLASADALFLFDGGELAPTGQEETLRDWIDAFRQLPAVPFNTWTPTALVSEPSKSAQKIKSVAFDGGSESFDDGDDASSGSEKSIQPLVVRYYRNEKETWVYLLNAAPFHLGVRLTMQIRPGATFKTFAGPRSDRPQTAADAFIWSYTSLPFDLVALRIDDPKAQIATVEISRPNAICGAGGRLSNEIQKLVDRILAAQSGVPLELRNGDFEESFAPRIAAISSAPVDAANAQNSESAVESKNASVLEFPKTNLFKRSTAAENETPNAVESPEIAPFDPNVIPGWRAFGPEDVVVRLDETVVRGGRASLLLSSNGNAGGVLGEPFEPPTTGRLCAQICFGVPADAQDLPLRVCLTGRRDGAPYLRRLVVGPTILERARQQGAKPDENGVVWIRDVVLFDRLPLDGFESASLRFDLLGPGRVWLDDVSLYKLAFADAEQNELMRVVNVAEFRISKNRVLDSLNLLDEYWAKLLKEEIPDDSPLLATRRGRTADVAAAPKETPADAPKKEDEKPKNGFEKALEKLKFW